MKLSLSSQTKHFRNAAFAGIVAFSIPFATMQASTAQEVVVDETSQQNPFDKFSEYDATNTQSINYAPMDEFYAAITSKRSGRQNFRYSLISGQGGEILDGYVNFISSISPTKFNKNEQLAYWLNLRNLLVIREITAASPLRNLKKQRGDNFNPGTIWSKQTVTVDNVPMSIDDIEKRIILANWPTPEIFYGLYQGIKGGPAFTPPVSFTGKNVQEELKSRAKSYINARRVVKVKGSSVEIPATYDWYRTTLFANDDAALIAHLTSYAENKLATKLSNVSSVSFSKVNYSLDQEQQRQQSNNFPRSGSSPAPAGSGS